MWAFGCLKKGKLYRELTKHNPSECRLFKNVKDPELFKEWLYKLLNNKFKNIQGDEEMKKHNVCQMTYQFGYIYLNGKFEKLVDPDKPIKQVSYFVKLEEIDQGLKKIEELFEIDFSECCADESFYNKSDHLDIVCYYNQDLLDLVYQKDRFIFEKFGYPKKILLSS